jgi:hypothetical protein
LLEVRYGFIWFHVVAIFDSSEEIDEKAFVTLNEEKLRKLGIKYGPAQNLMSIVNMLLPSDRTVIVFR